MQTDSQKEEKISDLQVIFTKVRNHDEDSYELLYNKCMSRLKSFLFHYCWNLGAGNDIEDACERITSSLYMRVSNGEFDVKKFSFDAYISYRVFEYIAESFNINPNQLRRVIRIRKLCAKYGLDMTHQNGDLLMMLSNSDGLYPLGTTEVHNAIDNALVIKSPTLFNDEMSLDEKPRCKRNVKTNKYY